MAIGPSLSSYVGFAPVVRMLYGNKLPARSLPTMVPCPVCGIKKSHGPQPSMVESNMLVTQAPEGGQSWYCYVCGRAWDTLELLADVRHSGKIRDAIHEVIRNPDFDIPRQFVSGRAIEDYVQYHVAPHRAAAVWSDEGRKRWASGRDLFNMLAENVGVKVHLLESFDAAKDRIGRWIHVTGRAKIKELLNADQNPGIPTDVFSSCLAIPWSSAPGRISALLLLGWRKMVRMWFPITEQNEDPGIMCLDALPRCPERVIAVSSPYLALWMQYQNFMEDNRPLPLVAWHDKTRPSVWERIGAKEVVFWDYEPSPELFKQALHTPNSKVSYLTNLPFKVCRETASIETYSTWLAFRNKIDKPQPVRQRVSDLTHRRLDPYQACRDYLLSLEPEHVAAVVEHMDLQQDQIKKLLESCRTFETRACLERLMDRTFRTRIEPMFGSAVVQHIGPNECFWALRRRGGQEERISDALLHLDNCIVDRESAETFYTGVVLFKGKRYPISCTPDQLKENSVRIIKDPIENAGDGSPYVSTSQGQRLTDIIYRFSHIEKTYPALTRVGWDKQRTGFVFPKFIIRSGGIEERDLLGLTGDVLPGMRVENPEPISSDEMNTWLEPTECNGAMWAVLTAVLDNIIGAANNAMPRGIGLVGNLAIKAADKISDDLGLMTYNTERVRQQFARFEKDQRDHDLPVLVRETEEQLMMMHSLSTWMLVPTPKNALMSLSPIQIATAVMCGDWLVVDTSVDDGDYYRDGSMAGLLVGYLSYWQNQNGRMPRADKPSQSTLLSVQEWARSVGKRDASFVFKYAMTSMRDAGRETVAARFIMLVIQLIHDGYLKHEYGTTMKERTGSPAVVINSEHSCIYVNKQKVVEALTRRNLPILDTPHVTAALREQGVLLGEMGQNRAGWVVDLGFWEHVSSVWSKANGAKLTSGI